MALNAGCLFMGSIRLTRAALAARGLTGSRAVAAVFPADIFATGRAALIAGKRLLARIGRMDVLLIRFKMGRGFFLDRGRFLLFHTKKPFGFVPVMFVATAAAAIREVKTVRLGGDLFVSYAVLVIFHP